MSVKVSETQNNETFTSVVGGGTTVRADSHYVYLGDGDGYTYHYGVILTVMGEVKEVAGAEITEDASPEVKAAAERVVRATKAVETSLANLESAKRTAEKVDTGREVEVFKKRAKGFGTKGKVFWIGESRYGTRVGVRVEGQADPFWTAISNLRVTDAASFAEILAEKESYAEGAAAECFEAETAAARVAVTVMADSAALAA